MGKLIKIIREIFDDFVIAARIKPAITLGLPMLLMTLYNGIANSKWVEAEIGLALTVVIMSFAAYIIRELGKTYEEKMYKELKGKPSTIILRFENDIIDDITKVKYHKWLNNKIADLQLPLSLEEECADTQSNSKYESAIRYLRNYANSHRDELPRVYQELKKYNYWRNLYGSKWYALAVYIILAIREILTINNFSIKQMFLEPYPKYNVLLLLIVWSGLFCIFVTKKTVKRNAFDYAKTLIETIEFISVNRTN